VARGRVIGLLLATVACGLPAGPSAALAVLPPLPVPLPARGDVLPRMDQT
jgi:hypothetical protein